MGLCPWRFPSLTLLFSLQVHRYILINWIHKYYIIIKNTILFVLMFCWPNIFCPWFHSGSSVSLTQDQCGVCEQLLTDPVITTCGHSFCRQCISSYWSQSGPSGDYSCPQCRKRSRAQPFLNPDITMAQPLLYAHTTMTQPPVYPPTAMAQSSLYQHREMAQLHLKPSTTMAQVPPYPPSDSGQDPLYPHLHMTQISPQPPLDEHIDMEGSKHLQTEPAPVKRAKLTGESWSISFRTASRSWGPARIEAQQLRNKMMVTFWSSLFSVTLLEMWVRETTNLLDADLFCLFVCLIVCLMPNRWCPEQSTGES